MAEKRFEALGENLEPVIGFLEENLESLGCPFKEQQQICIAVEELFVNIVNYAYPDSAGPADLEVRKLPEQVIEVVIRDSGVPFDPLNRQDPDITLMAEDRPIGGLGIYMVKKCIDEVTYHYENGQNILTLRKRVAGGSDRI